MLLLSVRLNKATSSGSLKPSIVPKSKTGSMSKPGKSCGGDTTEAISSSRSTDDVVGVNVDDPGCCIIVAKISEKAGENEAFVGWLKSGSGSGNACPGGVIGDEAMLSNTCVDNDDETVVLDAIEAGATICC